MRDKNLWMRVMVKLNSSVFTFCQGYLHLYNLIHEQFTYFAEKKNSSS